MTEFTKVLERAGERFAEPRLPLERVLRARDRKRRRQRVAAAVVACAIAVVAVAVVVRSFERARVPADTTITPDNVERLRELWSVRLPGGSAGPPLVIGNVIYVADGRQVRAYPLACASPCAPLWSGDAGAAIQSPGLTAGTDELFVEATDRLVAFPMRCAGPICHPDWVARVQRGYRVEYSGGFAIELGSPVAAYPEDCRDDGSRCSPRWVAPHACAEVGDGLVAVGCAGFGHLEVYSVSCGPGIEGCRPLWSSTFDRPELIAGGMVFASDFSGGDVIGAFPLSCPRTCSPVWQRPGYLVGASRGLAYIQPVSGGRSVVVYPAPCGSEAPPCRPLWESALAAGPSPKAIYPAANLWSRSVGEAGAAIGTSHRFVLLTPACPSRTACLSYVADTGVSDWASPVLVGDRIVFVGAFGSSKLLAFPLTCPQPCRSVWSWTAPQASGWDQPVLVGTRMVATSAGPSGSVLHVFGLGPGKASEA